MSLLEPFLRPPVSSPSRRLVNLCFSFFPRESTCPAACVVGHQQEFDMFHACISSTSLLQQYCLVESLLVPAAAGSVEFALVLVSATLSVRTVLFCPNSVESRFASLRVTIRQPCHGLACGIVFVFCRHCPGCVLAENLTFARH